jgi:hypothetical protein
MYLFITTGYIKIFFSLGLKVAVSNIDNSTLIRKARKET